MADTEVLDIVRYARPEQNFGQANWLSRFETITQFQVPRPGKEAAPVLFSVRLVLLHRLLSQLVQTLAAENELFDTIGACLRNDLKQRFVGEGK
jgi:hypothetical protein